jgi:hypothetical protein
MVLFLLRADVPLRYIYGMPNDETTYRRAESLLARMYERDDSRHDYIEKAAQAIDDVGAVSLLANSDRRRCRLIDLITDAQEVQRKALAELCDLLDAELDADDREAVADACDNARAHTDYVAAALGGH